MVLRADVLGAAIDAARARPRRRCRRIYLSPRGELLTQALVRELAAGARRAAARRPLRRHRPARHRGPRPARGVDRRLRAVGRRAGRHGADRRRGAAAAGRASAQPASLAEESFEAGLLEYPHYTRPRDWEGRAIPEVLLSGDHARIAEWRRAEAERLTAERRPDLRRKREDT